ncbi:MAG: hypothetical protein IJR60_06240 [Eubacterium sp.]|nr:hypothetical protein [Eubacterium sp.]
MSVKQNSPVDCFVARGGEIGTAAKGWGDEPQLKPNQKAAKRNFDLKGKTYVVIVSILRCKML